MWCQSNVFAIWLGCGKESQHRHVWRSKAEWKSDNGDYDECKAPHLFLSAVDRSSSDDRHQYTAYTLIDKSARRPKANGSCSHHQLQNNSFNAINLTGPQEASNNSHVWVSWRNSIPQYSRSPSPFTNPGRSRVGFGIWYRYSQPDLYYPQRSREREHSPSQKLQIKILLHWKVVLK